MTPQRARDVERICQAALEQEPSARAAFLVEACAGDAALRREVESLLAAESRAAGFLSTPAAAFAWDVSGDGATLIGRRLGPYEIQTRIGGGGMGDVYKARDTRLPRTVAVKVPKAPYSERFRREASAIAQLSHPHICTLHDIGPGYLVMEYVEGTPLKGPLPTERVMAYAGQILDALDAAHRQHVVHRDLKPDNILVTKQGIKLLDFGLAHTESSEEEPTLTGTGAVMGTPAYMAPEQRDGKRSDARSDIYAFGCVLHEMLTGKRVTAARPPAEPAALERVIKRCLAPAPDDRFQTARDLKTALEWAGESQVGTTSTHGWRKPWVAAVLTLVAILAGLGTWAVSRLRLPDIGGPVLRLQITPPEGGWFGVLSGERETLALSPDGRTAVYGASVDGKSALWLRSLDDTAARALPGTEDARQPFWSPDGKSIAFVANGKLQRLDVAGGPAFVICDVSHLRVYGGAWAPDGRILVGSFGGSLASVPASGGTLSPVTTLDRSKGEAAHTWPQVLPGGRFLFQSIVGSTAESVIYAASFEKPNDRVRLVESDTNALYASGPAGRGYLLWQRTGALVAQEFDSKALTLVGELRQLADRVARSIGEAHMSVAVSTNGTVVYSTAAALQQLTWFDRAGKQLGTVGDAGWYFAFRISPDGKRMATTRMDVEPDFWFLLFDLDRGSFRRSQGGFSPQWSPDGRTILLWHPTSALHRKDAIRTTPDQRLGPLSTEEWALTDWSRDGRLVLNTRNAVATRADLWVVPVTPDGQLAENEKATPYLRTPVNESEGRFSPEPNPRWVAYHSDESGRDEVYVQSFPEPRGPHRMSTNGGKAPQWGFGGRELFYQSLDGKVMAMSLKLGADSVEASAPRELFALSPQFSLLPDLPLSNFQVAPDGQRFLVRVPDPTPRPLTVIVNWPALLKQTAARQ